MAFKEISKYEAAMVDSNPIWLLLCQEINAHNVCVQGETCTWEQEITWLYCEVVGSTTSSWRQASRVATSQQLGFELLTTRSERENISVLYTIHCITFVWQTLWQSNIPSEWYLFRPPCLIIIILVSGYYILQAPGHQYIFKCYLDILIYVIKEQIKLWRGDILLESKISVLWRKNIAWHRLCWFFSGCAVQVLWNMTALLLPVPFSPGE